MMQGVSSESFASLIATRVELLIDALGGVTLVANCLGETWPLVSKWRAGLVVPTPAQARLILALDHVMARACCIFVPVVAKEWLFGHNSYLEGARPIDVLRVRGVSEVLEALDAAEQVAYG